MTRAHNNCGVRASVEGSLQRFRGPLLRLQPLHPDPEAKTPCACAGARESIRFLPALNVSKEEVDMALSIVEQALSDTFDHV